MAHEVLVIDENGHAVAGEVTNNEATDKALPIVTRHTLAGSIIPTCNASTIICC